MKPRRPVDYRVFERAIEFLDVFPGCCSAICWASAQGDHITMVEFFAAVMGQHYSPTYWWPRNDRGVRVIALQLAACVAKDGAL